MKLSFLIQLVLSLILIVGIYMIFNNQISGRNKMITMVVLLVIGIYLYNKLPFFRNYDELIDNPLSAKEEYVMTKKRESSGHFTISSWVYVDDWNYKYGNYKNICKIGKNDDNKVIKIGFDNYTNDLKIEVETMSQNKYTFQKSMYDTLINSGVPDDDICYNKITCENDFIYDNSNNTYYSNDTECDVDNGIIEGCIPCNNLTNQNIVVENINLQKWVNIIVAINDRMVDVYLNGKLVKSKTLPNVINVNHLNKSDLHVTSNGGFGGYISRLQYYPYFIAPQKAWNIYKDGFGDAFSNTLNRYNMKVTFYEDAVEKNKYWLF